MRKKFLIKPDIQFRHLAWTIGTILFCFFLAYALFESQISSSINHDPLDQSRWMELRQTFRLGFLLALVVLIICIGIENYLFFHTIVGPLYVIERGLKEMLAGNFQAPLRIRRSDQLKDLFKLFEKSRAQIRDRLNEQERLNCELRENLEKVLANISPTNIRSLRQKIREIKAQIEKQAA